jgi:MtN3 and saliva related transmembrane protein
VSIELVGWVAVVLTQVFWFPNISKIIRTRDVDGYSLIAWLVMFSGLTCWLLYFVAKGDIVGIVANTCGVTGAGITTACIWWWGSKRTRATRTEPLLGLEPLTSDQG